MAWRLVIGDIAPSTFSFYVSRYIPTIHGLSSPDKVLRDRIKPRQVAWGPRLLLTPSLQLLITMSASDVLRQFVKRDATSQESRRALDEFLRSPCYSYFLKTLKGSDVLGYADFLDKASADLGRNAQALIGSIDVEFGPCHGETLGELPERPPTDVWGSRHPPYNTCIVSRIDQKRKGFHEC